MALVYKSRRDITVINVNGIKLTINITKFVQYFIDGGESDNI